MPPYLCALYSLDPERNPEAMEVVGSVFAEKMLFLGIVMMPFRWTDVRSWPQRPWAASYGSACGTRCRVSRTPCAGAIRRCAG
ncbi:ferritin-like domain-containing protein [Nonomuraea sp. NPDC049480]|uniref:ferritin-like domain-containing protein n=1 Tax=Nonomuraea sp. NPDC049480 TaxID=3364353 RepID=UPI0037A45EC5